jgi:hypothetical protein
MHKIQPSHMYKKHAFTKIAISNINLYYALQTFITLRQANLPLKDNI